MSLTTPEAVTAGKPIKPRIFFATPAYGCQVTTFYVDSIVNTIASLTASGIHWKLHLMGNESLITRARNRLVADFLKSDCTHLVFLDADVGWEVNALADMVKSPHDIVCGAYPMKGYLWDKIGAAARSGMPDKELPFEGAHFAVNWRDEDLASGQIDAEDGYVKSKDGATGFMVIKRAAIERMVEHYAPEVAYTADYQAEHGETHFALFDCIIDKQKRYLSEDYAFCRRWQAIGGDIFIYLGAKLTHTGTHTWQGDVSKTFDLTPPPANANALPVDIVTTAGNTSPAA